MRNLLVNLFWVREDVFGVGRIVRTYMFVILCQTIGKLFVLVLTYLDFFVCVKN